MPVSVIPQINSRLVAISAPGYSEDWDDDAGAPTAKWTGDIGAYVIEKIRTNFDSNQGALVKSKDIQIIVPQRIVSQNGQIIIETGDIISYTFKGTTHNRRVQDYAGPYLPGVSQYLRLHLEEKMIEDMGDTDVSGE